MTHDEDCLMPQRSIAVVSRKKVQHPAIDDVTRLCLLLIWSVNQQKTSRLVTSDSDLILIQIKHRPTNNRILKISELRTIENLRNLVAV